MKKRLVYLNLLIPLVLLFLRGRYASAVIGMIVVIPGLLALLNLFLYLTGVERSWGKCCTFMLVGLLMPLGISYITWGISVGTLFEPDAETLAIMSEIVGYYLTFTAIAYVGVKVIGWTTRQLRKDRRRPT